MEELQEQGFEVMVLATRRAVYEVHAYLTLHVRGQLPIEVFVQVLQAFPAVHGV